MSTTPIYLDHFCFLSKILHHSSFSGRKWTKFSDRTSIIIDFWLIGFFIDPVNNFHRKFWLKFEFSTEFSRNSFSLVLRNFGVIRIHISNSFRWLLIQWIDILSNIWVCKRFLRNLNKQKYGTAKELENLLSFSIIHLNDQVFANQHQSYNNCTRVWLQIILRFIYHYILYDVFRRMDSVDCNLYAL